MEKRTSNMKYGGGTQENIFFLLCAWTNITTSVNVYIVIRVISILLLIEKHRNQKSKTYNGFIKTKKKKQRLEKENIKPQKEKESNKKKQNPLENIHIFKIALNTYVLVITLNVNGLNAPIKRHGVAEWI